MTTMAETVYYNLCTVGDQVINVLLQCVRHSLEIVKAGCEFFVFHVQLIESRAKSLLHFPQRICCLNVND